MKHDPETGENPEEKTRVRDRPALRDGGTPTEKNPSGNENQPTCFAVQKGDCPKGMPMITGIPPECRFHPKRYCKLGRKCAFKHTDKAGGEVKKRNNSVVVAKTLDLSQEEKKITSLNFMAKEDLLHGMSAIPEKSHLQKIVKNNVNSFWLLRIAEWFVKEGQKKNPTLRFQSGLNVKKKCLWNELPTHTMSWWNNMRVGQKKNTWWYEGKLPWRVNRSSFCHK